MEVKGRISNEKIVSALFKDDDNKVLIIITLKAFDV